MPIDQTITAFPAAPNAGSDTPEEFSNKADAFVAHQSDNYVGEVNQWATEANSTATDINNIVATLPEGTINDTVASQTSTYSSEKTDADYLIERGSNTRGVWAKFPDGTLIQHFAVGFDATNIAAGALFVGGSYFWEYPIPFAGAYAPVVTASNNSIANTWVSTVTPNYTDCLVRPISYATSDSPLTYRIMAIGRWK